MTNRMINLDESHNIDDINMMIKRCDELDLLPESIDYLIDDLDADPSAYLPDSPTFIALNDLDLDETTTITYRMILEIIAAELTDAITDLTTARTRITDML